VKKTSYSCDIFGNLKKVILPDQKVIEYVLDSQNRRVGKRVNGIMTRMYIYQSQTQIAAELDGQGKLISRYVYGTKANSPDYVVSNDQVIKVVSDQVGTPRAFVDAATGAIISKTHFDEFGIKSEPAAVAATELDSIGYAGGLFDADTGLTHFGAREYSADTGRWVSKDPIGFSGGDTNLYGYVLNDPLNYIDPEGTDSFLVVSGGSGGLPGHTYLVVNDPLNSDNFRAFDFFPSTGGLPGLDPFGSAGTVREQFLNAGQVGNLGSLILNWTTQNTIADRATIDRAKELASLAQKGFLKYNPFQISPNSLNCIGFAGAAQ
jgi:RHS repeat-associated protein